MRLCRKTDSERGDYSDVTFFSKSRAEFKLSALRVTLIICESFFSFHV